MNSNHTLRPLQTKNGMTMFHNIAMPGNTNAMIPRLEKRYDI